MTQEVEKEFHSMVPKMDTAATRHLKENFSFTAKYTKSLVSYAISNIAGQVSLGRVAIEEVIESVVADADNLAFQVTKEASCPQ